MKVIFEGWEPGMRKIPFIELLIEKAGLSLSEAKSIKDRLVDNGEIIMLNLEDKIDDLEKMILLSWNMLGMIGIIKNMISNQKELT